MSYQIEHKGKRFILSNKDTGRVIADHETKDKAMAQAKALLENESTRTEIKEDVEMNTE